MLHPAHLPTEYRPGDSPSHSPSAASQSKVQTRRAGRSRHACISPPRGSARARGGTRFLDGHREQIAEKVARRRAPGWVGWGGLVVRCSGRQRWGRTGARVQPSLASGEWGGVDTEPVNNFRAIRPTTVDASRRGDAVVVVDEIGAPARRGKRRQRGEESGASNTGSGSEDGGRPRHVASGRGLHISWLCSLPCLGLQVTARGPPGEDPRLLALFPSFWSQKTPKGRHIPSSPRATDLNTAYMLY
ncbi:hypothetical protein [Oryza sativa Japonica Group]|uniref:Uncharacterized protein n=1 Tax=Oryza sativa subsp. japonica TaxID=39947 RepID=Q5QLC7_ORYSJ|nr:hypothetical protein [Oryza sativa Japonica Group]